MKTMLREIKDLFAKERLYLYLFILIVFFYASILLIQKYTALESERMAPQTVSEAEMGETETGETLPATLWPSPDEDSSGLPWLFKLFSALIVLAAFAGAVLAARDLWRWYFKGELLPHCHVGGARPVRLADGERGRGRFMPGRAVVVGDEEVRAPLHVRRRDPDPAVAPVAPGEVHLLSQELWRAQIPLRSIGIAATDQQPLTRANQKFVGHEGARLRAPPQRRQAQRTVDRRDDA